MSGESEVTRRGAWRQVLPVPAQPARALLMSRRRWPPVIVLSLVLGLVLLLAVSWGSVSIPFPAIVRIIAVRLGLASGLPADWPASWEAIILTLRLPRVLLAGVVGAQLGLAGATYQGLFRNPLADPYLIGVASGAALGATAAVVLRLPPGLAQAGGTQWFAFVGGLVAVAAVYFLARVAGATPVTTLLLSGVAISALATAITSFLMYWHGDRLLAIYAWLLGGFTASSWQQFLLTLPYLLGGAAVLLPSSRVLDALQLGEEEATALGLNVERLKALLILVATLLTAAAVSVSGLIGFVGLIIPHIVRLIWGPAHRTLLPLSLLVGAIFLILADGAARIVLTPNEVPVGVLTALCGAPFFLVLLRRTRQQFF